MSQTSQSVLAENTKKVRDTNFELLRIILMYIIIAHHLVVNSGIRNLYNFQSSPFNTMFLELWGMWGKTAVNVFVLISGYFMCVSRLTWQRVLKLWLEIKFYRIIIYIGCLFMGYEFFSIGRVFKIIFNNICNLNNSFTASFLAFYLFIPFYNFVIDKMERKRLLQLIGLLLLMFTVSSTFFFNGYVFNYVGWYMTLYFIAAYIRIYPTWWMQSKRFTGKILMISTFASYASVICLVFMRSQIGGWIESYFFVSDSHKLLALVVSVFAFLWFKNLQIKNNRVINYIASTTFGVLLIHANSDAIRIFLWNDLLDVPSWFYLPGWKLVLYAIICPAVILIVGALIDTIRIYMLERPLFNWIRRNTNFIEEIAQKLVDKLKVS